MRRESGRKSVYLCRVSFDWWAALGSTHEGKMDPGFWLLQSHLQPECVREKGGGGRGERGGGRWKKRKKRGEWPNEERGGGRGGMQLNTEYNTKDLVM